MGLVWRVVGGAALGLGVNKQKQGPCFHAISYQIPPSKISIYNIFLIHILLVGYIKRFTVFYLRRRSTGLPAAAVHFGTRVCAAKKHQSISATIDEWYGEIRERGAGRRVRAHAIAIIVGARAVHSQAHGAVRLPVTLCPASRGVARRAHGCASDVPVADKHAAQQSNTV